MPGTGKINIVQSAYWRNKIDIEGNLVIAHLYTWLYIKPLLFSLLDAHVTM